MEIDKIGQKLCDIQGRLLANSVDAGYESEPFVRQFMRSKVAKALDSPYSRMQWMGEEYLMEALEAERNLRKGSLFYEKERLYWMGYAYRYWNLCTRESSLAILRAVPVRKLHKNYRRLQGREWDEVIAYFAKG